MKVMQDNDMDSVKKEIPVLFTEKSACCGCGACMNICPVKAISMREDQYGFMYPQIDGSVCIRCGRCKSVCSFRNAEAENTPIKTFAAVANDENLVAKSASGGVFAAMAAKIIKDGGAVCGAAFGEDWSVSHIWVDDIRKLELLQGSKYTQSNIGDTYSQAKKLLAEGRKVLYSGTPCQIAGLYGYLGKDYDNLFTVDIICHGVPNNRMFREYIGVLEKNTGGKITSFTFRDKSLGWGSDGRASIEKESGTVRKKLWKNASSYTYYFYQGWICRDSCYKCKYASPHRPADLTVGDYWGIEKAHPEYLGNKGWNESKGISVIIVNTKQGENLLQEMCDCIDMKPSDFEKAAMKNSQLSRPSSPGKREEILRLYEEGNWDLLDKRFSENIGWRKYSGLIQSLIPVSVKRRLKKL